MLEQFLKQLEFNLSISKAQISIIATHFREHMEQGLRRSGSSLKMFPSYLQAPNSNEIGTFLALDFGGSNARAAVVELKGDGTFMELHRVSRPLSDPITGRDLRAPSVNAEELFDFLAEIIQKVLDHSPLSPIISSSIPFPLGFTFSFPYHQRRIGEGLLLNWNKEIKTAGVVGKDVGELLCAALARQGLGSVVRPTAIINDTVATFLTAAYQDSSVDIASIIGTGHNTCYLEQKAPGVDGSLIINTESGNFSAVPETLYDQRLDQQSDTPGEQLFEKKLSGKYLGELFRQIILDFSERGFLDFDFLRHWNQPYSISSKDLSLILTAEDNHSRHLFNIPRAELDIFRRVTLLLFKRSARLVAASLIGVILHQDPHLIKPHTVAIDGSLYEGMPGYAQELTAALSEGLASKSSLVTVKLSAGGSLTGAAIAAALEKLM
ncbi:hexokinase [Desulfosporosinus sp.]|uniref:hexokinase n=1 Tax=Desulfosporosinus sp. TaxID=157907 RepID=UPI0025BDA260|nr:hexokinase [Desulfosporosinus sp.]MBC2723352.1 hexokinase [Desulfosporosinus sp.]MBC2725175.1 hexokinase [Desulfosporosinus sp.]